MPVTARRDARGRWGFDYCQLGARWYQAADRRLDPKQIRALEKELNRRMAAGDDLRPAHKRPAIGPTPPTGETFATFANNVLVQHQHTWKANTIENFARNLRLYILPVLGTLPVRDVTRERVIAFLEQLKTTHGGRTKKLLSHTTRVSIHLTITGVLSAAVEANRIPSNPAFRMGKYLRNPDEALPVIHVWTPDEADRFLATVKRENPFWYPLFFVALRTGLRAGELVELRWDRDFRHPHKVHVQRAYGVNARRHVSIGADGSPVLEKVQGHDHVTPPKGKRTRLVDLSGDVERVLVDHRAAQARAGHARRDGLTFTSPRGGARVNWNNLEIRVMTPLATLAGVPVLGMHDLRHTYATTLLSRGVDLAYVSRQLGHAHLETTQRHYQHWIADAALDAARVARLDAVWAVTKPEDD